MSFKYRRENEFVFHDSVLFGHYHQKLADFARNEAQKIKDPETISTTPTKPEQKAALFRYYVTLNGILGDWPFLITLSIVVSLLSFGVDITVYVLNLGKKWALKKTQEYVFINYSVWTAYNVVLVMVAAVVVRYLSPQAAGAGLAEVKVVVRGIILNDHLSFSTLISKIIGLPLVLATNLGVGKEGPFIHIASMVMYQLFHPFNFFSMKSEYNVRFQELVAIAAAIGVSASFATPIGGVLFSVEIIRSFLAVSSYSQAFIAATVASFMYRLFFVLMASEKLNTHLLKTNFREVNAYYPSEVIFFILLGLVCGLLAWFFISVQRILVEKVRGNKIVFDIFYKYPFIYPFTAAFVVATFKYKLFLGQYTSTWLPVDRALHSLYTNFTWNSSGYKIDGNITSSDIVKDWSTKYTSFYANLFFFFVSYLVTTLLATTVYVPGGLVMPLFMIGGGFGRFYGEVVSSFLIKLNYSASNHTIVVGAYAVASSAALCGSVTGSLATTVIAAELTGQLTHFIPMILCVITAHLCARNLGPSIFDSLIQMKGLPFLPAYIKNTPEVYKILVEEFMNTNVPFVWKGCTYEYLKDVLSTANLTRYPYVHSPASKYLLGTIHVTELTDLMELHLSDVPNGIEQQTGEDKKTEMPEESEKTNKTESLVSEEETNHLKEAKLKQKLSTIVDFESCHIDAAPLQVMQGTQLINIYNLFSLLNLQIIYVTSLGVLQGVVTLEMLTTVIEAVERGEVRHKNT